MLAQLQISEPRYLGCYFFNGHLGEAHSGTLVVPRSMVLPAIRSNQGRTSTTELREPCWLGTFF